MRLTSIAVPIVLCFSIRAQAQITGALDVGGGLGQSVPGAWLRESMVAPSLRLFNRSGFLHLDADLVERGGELSLRRERAAGAVSTPTLGALRLTLAADYTHDLRAETAARGDFTATTALSARWGATGVRTAVGRQPDSDLRLELGGWRAWRGVIVSVTAGNQLAGVDAPWSRIRTISIPDSVFNDTTGQWNHFQGKRTFTESGIARRLRGRADMEGRVDWSMGRFTMTAAMSARAAADSARTMVWGRMIAATQMNPRLSLTVGAGTQPLGLDARRASRFATIGVRLSPAAFLRPPPAPGVRTTATAFATAHAEDGAIRFTVRAPNARTVELSGDFTGWAPVALREVSPDVWQVTIGVAPGTHRINLRIDGDSWTAPPGLPAVEDEFNGRVGLFIVR